MQLSDIYTARKAGIRVLTIEEGDELISVMKTSGEDNILIATRQGMAICFNENDVRCMGRMAAGVRGIRLKDGDMVVGAAVAEANKTLLSVTERGYGKRTPVESYMRGDEVQSRGGMGKKNYRITEKTGAVVGACVVADNEDLLMIESGGVVLRTAVDSISISGRDTQGVIIMRVNQDNRLIAVQNTLRTEDEANDE
ncbi:MAG: DNA gyrase subunit A, partial [Oscillospiraceae bacterium]|nr:DNA gyrase subunit A [Oscillospiraceae bacterium]